MSVKHAPSCTAQRELQAGGYARETQEHYSQAPARRPVQAGFLTDDHD